MPWVLTKRKDATRGLRVACWDFFDHRKLFWAKSDLSGGCQAVRENEASYQKMVSGRFLLSMVRSGPAMFQRMLQFSVGCKRSGTPPAKIVRHRCPALPGGVAPIFRSRMNPCQASQADREEYDNLGTNFFKIHQVASEIQIFEDACENQLFGPKTSKYTYWNDL